MTNLKCKRCNKDNESQGAFCSDCLPQIMRESRQDREGIKSIFLKIRILLGFSLIILALIIGILPNLNIAVPNLVILKRLTLDPPLNIIVALFAGAVGVSFILGAESSDYHPTYIDIGSFD